MTGVVALAGALIAAVWLTLIYRIARFGAHMSTLDRNRGWSG